jgi:hypothetical protein
LASVRVLLPSVSVDACRREISDADPETEMYYVDDPEVRRDARSRSQALTRYRTVISAAQLIVYFVLRLLRVGHRIRHSRTGGRAVPNGRWPVALE